MEATTKKEDTKKPGKGEKDENMGGGGCGNCGCG